MIPPKKVVHFQASSILQVFLLSLSLLLFVWLFFIFATDYLKVPLPTVKIESFSELIFFSISLFSFFIFLTIVPFQVTADRLSPAFYHKIYNIPSAHFGVSLVLLNTIVSFFVVALHQAIGFRYLNQLFISLIACVIIAILHHRFWVIRCLYQPYLAYKYVETLQEIEPLEEAWLELFECTVKAVKQNRVNDVDAFLSLMEHVYNKCSKENRVVCRQKEDVLSLHNMTKENRPMRRFIEERWPFCVEEQTEVRSAAFYE